MTSLGWSLSVGTEAVISGLKKEALNTLLFSTENGGRLPRRTTKGSRGRNDGLSGGGDAAINRSRVQVENQSVWRLRFLGKSLKMSSKSWTQQT